MTMSNPGMPTVAIIGSGWRAEFFLRLTSALADRLTLTGTVVRRPEAAERATARWGVPSYLSPSELLARQRPNLVVVAVAWDATPAVIVDVASAGTHVLAETPPAPDETGLRALWTALGPVGTPLVHVAEQYLLMPGHAARREAVQRGLIGTPTSVQVSSTHGYHAVSMIRGLLRTTEPIGFGPVTVDARRFTAPLVDPLTRDGWTGDPEPHPATTTLAMLDFGDGRSGLYDFTDNQWHNRLRARRIVIRGSHGEIVDDRLLRLAAPETVLTSTITRNQLGHDLNLDGHDTELLSVDGTVLWRNRFLGHRLMDEEIAIATALCQAADWSLDCGPGPYPLAEACQDHLLSLAIDEAAALGTPITTATEPWDPSNRVD
jgi:predicted dehydrogenase